MAMTVTERVAHRERRTGTKMHGGRWIASTMTLSVAPTLPRHRLGVFSVLMSPPAVTMDRASSGGAPGAHLAP